MTPLEGLLLIGAMISALSGLVSMAIRPDSLLYAWSSGVAICCIVAALWV